MARDPLILPASGRPRAPGPPPGATRKLVIFLAVVFSWCAGIFVMNETLNARESAFSAAGSAELRAGLEKVHANPGRLGMTMDPQCIPERELRKVNSRIIDPPDVVELGMSDADHMSGTFFRDDVRFYNSFISNSFYAYQYEAFEELLDKGAPKLVLDDVRSGYLMYEGPEPAYDAPPDDPVWWCGVPHSNLAPTRTLGDVASLLSLNQTESSLATLLRWARQSRSGGAEEADDGEQYRAVLASPPSKMNRWLADGSRVYVGEHDGVLVPRGQERVEEQRGERRVNESRLAMLETYIKRIAHEVPDVILYSPPVSYTVLEDPRQPGYMAELSAKLHAMAARQGVDYCDLSTRWSAIGCTREDFYDEIHLSRHCNERVVRALATGCAPKAGPKLAKMLRPEVLSGGGP
jgi:hypothetical protein